jgi:biopolymer transport protein ExbD
MSQLPKRKLADKIPIDMTPMIDIVFQLLTFFCMTLKIVAAEGDFHVRMPAEGTMQGPPITSLSPIHIHLKANDAGECTRVVLADLEFSGADRWDRVHNHLARVVGEGNLASEAEVELHCDPQLHYEHAMAAITAVSGRINPGDGEIIRLIDKIKFSPVRQTN